MKWASIFPVKDLSELVYLATISAFWGVKFVANDGNSKLKFLHNWAMESAISD